MAIPTPPLHNKFFRILIRTESGAGYSWFGNLPNDAANATGIFVNNNNNNVSLANIITHINRMVKCTYIDDKNAGYGSATLEVTNEYGGTADNLFNGANNVWLEAHAGDDGHVGFRHTDTADSADPFAKVKFFGANVCSVLGLPENVWLHGSGFNLSVNDNIESSFKGVVIADELNVDGYVNFSPNARAAGQMVFDVSGSEGNDQGIMLSVGTSIFGKFGYDTFSSGSLCQVDLVRSSGDVIALYTSDERLKDDVQYILDPVSKVKQLNGVEFKWNHKQKIYPVGTKDVGIIAQDLQKVYPELVSESSTGYLGVKHDRLVALLIEAVKEQNNEIESLKSRITDMENNNAI